MDSSRKDKEDDDEFHRLVAFFFYRVRVRQLWKIEQHQRVQPGDNCAVTTVDRTEEKDLCFCESVEKYNGSSLINNDLFSFFFFLEDFTVLNAIFRHTWLIRDEGDDVISAACPQQNFY